jgi:mevalonate kinase
MASIPTLRRRRVCASAPGKAILFGEHAVVYGKTAVAVAVSDLRIQAQLVSRTNHVILLPLPYSCLMLISFLVSFR